MLNNLYHKIIQKQKTILHTFASSVQQNIIMVAIFSEQFFASKVRYSFPERKEKYFRILLNWVGGNKQQIRLIYSAQFATTK